MLFGDATREEQPDAHAARHALRRGGAAVEPREDRLEVFVREPEAGVLHDQAHAPCLRLQADGDLPGVPGELHRVVQQALQHLPDAARVHERDGVPIDADGMPVCGHAVEDADHERTQVRDRAIA